MPKPTCKIESDGTGIFVVFDGKRIARRGSPGTPEAKTWVSLEPGFAVYDNDDLSELTVEVNGVRVN